MGTLSPCLILWSVLCTRQKLQEGRSPSAEMPTMPSILACHRPLAESLGAQLGLLGSEPWSTPAELCGFISLSLSCFFICSKMVIIVFPH